MKLLRLFASCIALLPALALAVPFGSGVAPAANQFVAGRDYFVLANPLPTASGDKLEVREFFFYGCSHCYNLEGPLNTWLRTKPADVAFERTPVMFNPKAEPLARAYFVAEELGALGKVHAPLYDALHAKGEKLYEKDPVIAFFVRQGLQKQAVESAWSSFSVNTKVRNAEQLAIKYMIRGTPTLAVAGKYTVSAGERSFAIVDYLLAQERAARAKK